MNRQSAVVLLILSASLQPSQASEYRYPGVYLQERPRSEANRWSQHNELRPSTDGAWLRSKVCPGTVTAVPYADISQGSSLADVTRDQPRHVS